MFSDLSDHTREPNQQELWRAQAKLLQSECIYSLSNLRRAIPQRMQINIWFSVI